MGAYRRVNVASGRPLEKLAHYSRALRAGDTVLQSGTTAIDRQGNVRGVGDVARQVDAIMRIAQWSMGRASGRLDDVVRSRIYVTDIALADQAARAHAKYFRDARPVSTLVQVNGLARPEQLVEIELDAVDGVWRRHGGSPRPGHRERVRIFRAVRWGTGCSSRHHRPQFPRVVEGRATCTADPRHHGDHPLPWPSGRDARRSSTRRPS
jgi:enamine deaminase RidA (YjgF/YER057c/UK114 family)